MQECLRISAYRTVHLKVSQFYLCSNLSSSQTWDVGVPLISNFLRWKCGSILGQVKPVKLVIEVVPDLIRQIIVPVVACTCAEVRRYAPGHCTIQQPPKQRTHPGCIHANALN